MSYLLILVYLLVLSHTSPALPIKVAEAAGNPKSPSWEKWLPVAGTLGFLSGLIAVVVLGTKANEEYNAAMAEQYSDAVIKFGELSPEEQRYATQRMQYFLKDLSKEQKTKLEIEDKEHGWPKMELPYMEGMNRATRKELEAIHKKFVNAVYKFRVANCECEKAQQELESVLKSQNIAQFRAAILAVTDWKTALEKASISTSVSKENWDLQ